jgi:phosphoenolpyruvate-protein phosphotransferase (PTS system enzyme I)
MASTGGEGADMLEFQLAMLDDDSLSEAAFADIRNGEDANVAWRAALETQIATYDSADNDYFRARGADLRDIRDRVARALAGDVDGRRPSGGSILAGDDITPSQFLAVDWSKGGAIVLRHGSAASHVAMLARARGVPMLVGVADLQVNGAQLAIVDAAETGTIVLDPDVAQNAEFLAFKVTVAAQMQQAVEARARPAATADGTPITVNVNVAEPSDVDAINIAHCDGVGLMRTEFLYSSGLPDEETQLRAYARVLDWAAGKPVVIRTVDAGGDKPVPGFTVAESNPFLGLRGIRLALRRPDVFRVQIRALLRAAVRGNLKVMFPMVTVPEEYRLATALFVEEAAYLAAANIPHQMPPFGIMVEVPAVALAPELFGDVAFFSIGSNDLTQYVMAAARDNGAVGALNVATHIGVLRLIENVVRGGGKMNIPVSLCGDAGSDPAAIGALLATGLRSLSVSPAQLALAKSTIATVAIGT